MPTESATVEIGTRGADGVAPTRDGIVGGFREKTLQAGRRAVVFPTVAVVLICAAGRLDGAASSEAPGLTSPDVIRSARYLQSVVNGNTYKEPQLAKSAELILTGTGIRLSGVRFANGSWIPNREVLRSELNSLTNKILQATERSSPTRSASDGGSEASALESESAMARKIPDTAIQGALTGTDVFADDKYKKCLESNRDFRSCFDRVYSRQSSAGPR